MTAEEEVSSDEALLQCAYYSNALLCCRTRQDQPELLQWISTADKCQQCQHTFFAINPNHTQTSCSRNCSITS